MDNTLKFYVREYITSRVADYDGNVSQLLRDATRRVKFGWWADLLYVWDFRDMAKEHADAIESALVEYHNATGKPFVWTSRAGSWTITSKQIIAALRKLRNDEKLDHDEHEAAKQGIEFVVEWFAKQIARELRAIA